MSHIVSTTKAAHQFSDFTMVGQRAWMTKNFRILFYDSIKHSISQMALQEPNRLEEIIKPYGASENGLVHSMIAIGYTSAPETMATIPLEYLCGDLRQMALENYEEV